MQAGEILGKKIAMVSALGGQGCTFTAAYMGSAMSGIGRNVAMLDLCGFGGTLIRLLGAAEDAVMNAEDVIYGRCLSEDAVAVCNEHLKIIPSAAFSGECISPYSVDCRRLVENLSREGDVIVDIPAGAIPDCGAVRCFDMFAICTRTDCMSLKYAAALRRIIKNLAAECNCKCEVRLILTKFSYEYMRAGKVGDIDECIDIVGAKLLGIVPYEKSAFSAAVSEQPIDAACNAMSYCRDIARRICGEKVPLETKNIFSSKIFG